MGGIADEHLEWAVVNRLKAMLDEPPKTNFNVTQSFALFNAVLLWTKNRAWVAGYKGERQNWSNQADHKAHNAREAMRDTNIIEAPWLLSLKRPRLKMDDRDGDFPGENAEINVDFVGMTAEAFFKWLRDAIAHGDGRSIKPIHKQSIRTGKTLLAGFEIVFKERRDSKKNLTLALYHDDMIRIGTILADLFCHSLSGGDRYFEREAGTASIEEMNRAV